jgi:hypothetical protein
MISVLVNDRNASGFKTRGAAVDLFAAQEIRLVNGPLFVNHPCQIEREQSL